MELADAAQEVFLAQPLLTSVAVHADSTSAGIAGLEVGAVLMLTLVEPDQRVKVQVALRLSNMLAHAHPGEPTEHYNTARWYSKVQYMCVAHNPELFISCVALSNSAARNAVRPLLPCNFAVHSPRTLGKLMMTSQSQGLRHCDNASTIIPADCAALFIRVCCCLYAVLQAPACVPSLVRLQSWWLPKMRRLHWRLGCRRPLVQLLRGHTSWLTAAPAPHRLPCLWLCARQL